MKQILSILIAMLTAIILCLFPNQNMVDMTTSENDEYAAIVWEQRTYAPYCVIERSRCGKQIGIVDGDKKHKVFEFEGYSADEWLIDYYVTGLMDNAMLYKEITVTTIPDGLQSDYEWNN